MYNKRCVRQLYLNSNYSIFSMCTHVYTITRFIQRQMQPKMSDCVRKHGKYNVPCGAHVLCARYCIQDAHVYCEISIFGVQIKMLTHEIVFYMKYTVHDPKSKSSIFLVLFFLHSTFISLQSFFCIIIVIWFVLILLTCTLLECVCFGRMSFFNKKKSKELCETIQRLIFMLTSHCGASLF